MFLMYFGHSVSNFLICWMRLLLNWNGTYRQNVTCFHFPIELELQLKDMRKSKTSQHFCKLGSVKIKDVRNIWSAFLPVYYNRKRNAQKLQYDRNEKEECLQELSSITDLLYTYKYQLYCGPFFIDGVW